MAVMNAGEPEHVFQEYWRNVYLRGMMLHDLVGSTAWGAYMQPNPGIPVERAFIIGSDQTVVLPVFSYKPQLMVDTIYELLAEMSAPGDLNEDGNVDLDDYATIAACLSGPDVATPPPGCSAEDFDAADIDFDGDVDAEDFLALAVRFTG
jgi:hypothetical protein